MRLRTVFLSMLGVFALLATAAGPTTSHAGAQNEPIRINEILASNDSFIPDEYGEFEDWIELHNTGAAPVDLSGWGLSDDEAAPLEWTFPAGTTIAANGYVIVYASKSDPLPGSGNLHASFSLSAGGEFLSLANADGQIVDSLAPTFPAQTTDISYGVTAGGQLGFFTNPSPGAANAGPGVVSEVAFSVDHGFFDNQFGLQLTSATAGATIRYTLDGSEPTLANGSTFSGVIMIDGTSIVRARAFEGAQSPSKLATQTYLFTADIIQQDDSPPGWPTDSVNGQEFDFGMDPNVVDGNEASVRGSLESIPTMSLVTDLDNLFDADTGIYVNAEEGGREWERPGSLELIDPAAPDAGFEVNAGIRIRGGFSRRDDNPKHAFRIFFRSEYGDAKLDYPLFGADGTDSFEKIDLRTAQNYSWAEFSDPQSTFVRELWSRDSQLDMGQPSTRSEYYHLYVNGQYFGIFQTQERVSKEYAESYFGGAKDDYDVVKSDTGLVYATTATDGTTDAWNSLWPLVSDETVTNSEYQTIADQVDLTNLADYYLLHFFSGDFDGAPSWFVLRNEVGSPYNRANNWQAIRDRNGGKWQFFEHDSEHSLCIRDGGPDEGVDIDNTTPWLSGSDNPEWNATFFNPGWLHQSLLSNTNYRQLFSDRVHLQLLDAQGALSLTNSRARLDQRSAEVAGAILAHSARWGDGGENAEVELATVTDWQAEVEFVRNTCLAGRHNIVQTQLAADGLMPTLVPPVFQNPGGAVGFGANVTISNPNGLGTVVYSIGGDDPRGLDNQPIPGAVASSTVTITDYVSVTARVRNGGAWSPPATATYDLASIPTDPAIILNEYNAVEGSRFLGNNAVDETFGRVQGNGGDWFEMVVLEDELDLRGWQFELISGEGDASATRDVLELTTAAALGSIPAGTIITVSENQPDDTTVDPIGGDWSMNLRSNTAGDGQFFTDATQQNFDTNAEEWQLIIRDDTGAVRALKTGERAGALTGVGPTEVGKLEATPTTAITPQSNYDDGTTSTFGLPNRWDAELQDLSGLRGFARPGASVVPSCYFENGRFDVSLTNSGNQAAAMTVTLTGLPPRARTVNPGATVVVQFTGRQDGEYRMLVESGGASVFDQMFTVECDPAVRVVSGCLQQNGRLDVFILNRDAAAATYSVSFGNLDRTTTIAGGDDGRVSITGRPDGPLVVTVERGLAQIYSETELVDCDPPGPEVDVRVSCLSFNGWVRVDIDNDDVVAHDYVVFVGHLTREATLGAKAKRTVSVTGRADGPIAVSVQRDGQPISNRTVQVNCDPSPGSEVTVLVGCLGGFGRLDVTLFNNSGAAGSYEVLVGSLAGRTRQVDANAIDKVTITGRPNGSIPVVVNRNNIRVFVRTETVNC